MIVVFSHTTRGAPDTGTGIYLPDIWLLYSLTKNVKNYFLTRLNFCFVYHCKQLHTVPYRYYVRDFLANTGTKKSQLHIQPDTGIRKKGPIIRTSRYPPHPYKQLLET